MPYSNRYPALIERTLGDGNCAFNAFALGIVSKNLLSAVETQLSQQKKDSPKVLFQGFIKAVAEEFSVQDATWDAIKQLLLTLRHNDKEELQRKLAPILRQLAIEQARQDAQHYNKTLEPLKSAFYNYIYKKMGYPVRGVQDDVYIKHDFIEGEFNNLYQEFFGNNQKEHLDEYQGLIKNENRTHEDNKKLKQFDEQMNQQLLLWWKENGYNQFLTEMEQNGEWAGELELILLARYFHVHVNIYRDELLIMSTRDHGELPRQNEEYRYQLQTADIKQLVARQIINNPDTAEPECLSLLPLTPLALHARLDAVPEYQAVSKFIDDQGDRLKTLPVPCDWSQDCVKELIHRNVVDQSKKFIVKSKVAQERIKEMQYKTELIAAWQTYYQALPTVALSHTNGGHWDNRMVSSAVGSETRLIKTPKEQTTFYKDLCHDTVKLFSKWKKQSHDLNTKSWDELIKELDETSGNHLLCFMAEDTTLEKDKLYVKEKEKGKFVYAVMTSQGKVKEVEVPLDLQVPLTEEAKTEILEIALKNGDVVTYSIGSENETKTVRVTREKQIALDEALATKIQKQLQFESECPKRLPLQ
ncbi:MAG TPA: hypothetical protein VJN02_08335 [Gammaproteobacteria bacterium]|nr:hypothetical protein [Gammaproteobacteria bacterium]